MYKQEIAIYFKEFERYCHIGIQTKEELLRLATDETRTSI